MAVAFPTIGTWFRRSNGALFEVVAVDEANGTVEIQFFDATISQIDLENWAELLLVEASAPEDWSGSVDMDPEDFVGQNNGDLPIGYHDPLDFLDRMG